MASDNTDSSDDLSPIRCQAKPKLEQLERLRSEDTPRRLIVYPHYWVMLDPKSKQGRKTLKI